MGGFLRPVENVDKLGDEYDAMKIIHALHRIKKRTYPAPKASDSKSSILQTTPSKSDLGFKINLIVALDSRLSYIRIEFNLID